MSRFDAVLQRHGWTQFVHPLFLDRLERLTSASARARRADPDGWQSNANVKLLAALRELVLGRVRLDPLAPAFRGFVDRFYLRSSAVSFLAVHPERYGLEARKNLNRR